MRRPCSRSSRPTPKIGGIVAVAALSLLFVGPASAQVSGVVRDLAMNPVEGAIVSLQATDQRTETDATGAFSLPGATGTDLVIVAAKRGYFNSSITVSSPATSQQLLLEEVPPMMFSDYIFIGTSQCEFCHPNQVAEWNGSRMQQAGLNSWVYDLYNGTGTAGGMNGFVYTLDSPRAATFPEAECASCHQPQAWIKDPFQTALADFALPTQDAMVGVSCETCHKIREVDESLQNATGMIELNGAVVFSQPDLAGGDSQVMYGALGDVSFQAPIMRASYNPGLRSNTCAACHEYNNDHDLDQDWEEPGSVPAQETYSEWQNSPYGDPMSPMYADCVDCHMPPAAADSAICEVIFPPLVRDADTVRSHDIQGTTAAYLENAVTMTVDVDVVGTSVDVQVDIVNDKTGHSVPSGVTIRNMVLLVEAFDAMGTPLVHTGAQVIDDLAGVGNPVEGNYGGLAGKYFAKVLGDAMGEIAPIFTESTQILYDTRIPALATDSTNYTFELPSGATPGQVRARLIYRRAPRPVVLEKGWTVGGQGDPLPDVTPPYYGHLMEEVIVTPPAPPTDVVIAGELPSDVDSVSALVSALEANGRVVDVTTELTLASTDGYQAIWVCLGTYPDNLALSAAQGQVLADRNAAGIPVYLEGGDYYGFDAPTPFADQDGGIGLSDGDDTFVGMVGLDSGFGLNASGLAASYTQDQTGNDYTDQLEAVDTELGGPDSGAIWADDMTGGGSGYIVGLFYNSTFAPVITQSWEFGGYGGDSIALAALYRDALLNPVLPELFDRGDCNGDGMKNIADAVALLDGLFAGGGDPACFDACDANDDGAIDIADAIATLGVLFGGTGGFPAPDGGCGEDPTADGLDCVTYTCP